MSSSIWTRCAGTEQLRRLRGYAWRVVESQYVNSTRKLVDSDEEQALLEDLLEERSKLPLPSTSEFHGLHYLLATPFRYPPLRHGSRFGTRSERGIWYGARKLETAFAELAYYRFVFLAGTMATLAPLYLQVSPFRASLSTSRGVDLRAAPFSAHGARISSKNSYGATQRLGRDMRAARVDAFLWASARDPAEGASVGVLSPRAFGAKVPEEPESWRCVVGAEVVELRKQDVFRSRYFKFERSIFLVQGKLPMPAV